MLDSRRWPTLAALTTIQDRQFLIPEGMIDLGLGQPDPSVYPVDVLRAAAASCYRSADNFLGYGAEYGDGHHRVALAGYLTSAYGVPIDPEMLLSTNGNSQGLDLVCSVFTQPGDTVIVEEPTYFLAGQTFADHYLRVVTVPLDDDGIDLDALAATLDRLAAAKQPPRLVYTIPAFHNPTGINLTAARRSALAPLAAHYGTLLVADEVYQLLDYGSDRPPPMSAAVEHGNVISLGTFSKILAPGLRLGWIHAVPDLLRRIVKWGVIVSGGGLNPVTSALVTEVIRSGGLANNVAALRSEYTRRVEVMDKALHDHLPGDVSWRRPAGGYFFWLRLPEGVDGTELRRQANQVGLDFRQGSLFSTESGLHGFIRLSFAYYLDSELVEGAVRLGRALRS